MGLFKEYVSTTTEPKSSSYLVLPLDRWKKKTTSGTNRLTVALNIERERALYVCVCACERERENKRVMVRKIKQCEKNNS